MEKAVGARRRKPVKISKVVCGGGLDGEHDLEGLEGLVQHRDGNLEMILSEAKMKQMFSQVQTMSPAFYQQMARELHEQQQQEGPLPLLNKLIPLPSPSPQKLPYNLSKSVTITPATSTISPMESEEFQTEPWDLSIKSNNNSTHSSPRGGWGGKRSYNEFYANTMRLFDSPPKKGKEELIIPNPDIIHQNHHHHLPLPLKREMIEQFRQQFESRVLAPYPSRKHQLYHHHEQRSSGASSTTRVPSGSNGSGGSSPPIVVPRANKGVSSKKDEIANKPKQQRYRTERPFACPHCPAKFTLRSNMERHGKHQHPTVWQRSPSNRVLNKQRLLNLGSPTTSGGGMEDNDNVHSVLSNKLKSKLCENALESLAQLKQKSSEEDYLDSASSSSSPPPSSSGAGVQSDYEDQEED